MIVGRIDEFGRAMIPLTMRASLSAATQTVEVWVDTGFTGELVLSESLVNQLHLPQSSMVAAALADGSRSLLKTYSCVVDWFDGSREIEVIANQGQVPLLGVGLLLGHRLVADYEQLALTIE